MRGLGLKRGANDPLLLSAGVRRSERHEVPVGPIAEDCRGITPELLQGIAKHDGHLKRAA